MMMMTHRQPTHGERSLGGLQRPVCAEQKGHVGRAEGVSGGSGATGGDRRQTAGKV